MTQFTVRNVWTSVECSKAIADAISDELAVFEKNYFFADAYKKGYWDGKRRFFHARYNLFYTGLLPKVVKFLSHRGIPFTVIDDRGRLPETLEAKALTGLSLRDDQEEVVSDALANTLTWGSDGALWFPRRTVRSPTGTGKTVILAALASRIVGQVGILVHRKEILHQTVEEVSRLTGESVGIMGDGEYRPGRIVAATVQTLYAFRKKNRWLQSLDALLLDECQHYKAKTFEAVATSCPAAIRIGVSATPWPDDEPPAKMTIIGLTGDEFETGSPGEYIDKKILAPVEVMFLPVRTPVDIGHLPWAIGDDTLNAYDQGIVFNADRNKLLITMAKHMQEAGKRTLILASRIPHGLLLSEALGAVPYLTGETPSVVRKQTLADFRTGAVPLLIATTIFDEGVNVPAINCLILAGGGKSETQILQRIGRGMRKKLDGSGLIVLDCMDYQHRILLRHSKARKQICEEAGFSVADLS